jgi:hypothetical protein
MRPSALLKPVLATSAAAIVVLAGAVPASAGASAPPPSNGTICGVPAHRTATISPDVRVTTDANGVELFFATGHRQTTFTTASGTLVRTIDGIAGHDLSSTVDPVAGTFTIRSMETGRFTLSLPDGSVLWTDVGRRVDQFTIDAATGDVVDEQLLALSGKHPDLAFEQYCDIVHAVLAP